MSPTSDSRVPAVRPQRGASPERGEVWDVEFSPAVGRERSGRRPALIVSVDGFNAGPADLVIALPITFCDEHIPAYVPVDPPEGGLDARCFIKCEDVRSISKLGLQSRRGRISGATLPAVEDRLRILMDL